MHDPKQEIEHVVAVKKGYSGGEVTKPRFDNVLKKYTIINEKIKEKETNNQDIFKEIKLIELTKKKIVSQIKVENINSIQNTNSNIKSNFILASSNLITCNDLNTNTNNVQVTATSINTSTLKIENLLNTANLFNSKTNPNTNKKTVKNTALHTKNNSIQLSEEKTEINKSPNKTNGFTSVTTNLFSGSKSKVLYNSKKIFSPNSNTSKIQTSALCTAKNTQLNTNKNSLKSSSSNSKTNLFANSKFEKKEFSESKLLKSGGGIANRFENKFSGSKTGTTTPKTNLLNKGFVKNPNSTTVKYAAEDIKQQTDSEASLATKKFKLNDALKSSIGINRKNLAEKSNILRKGLVSNPSISGLVSRPDTSKNPKMGMKSEIGSKESKDLKDNKDKKEFKKNESKLIIKKEESKILSKKTNTNSSSPNHLSKFCKEKPKNGLSQLKLESPPMITKDITSFNKRKINSVITSKPKEINKIGPSIKSKTNSRIDCNSGIDDKLTNKLNNSEASDISTRRDSNYFKAQAENIIKSVKDCKIFFSKYNS